MDNRININTDDPYIRNKKKYIKLSIVSGILLFVFLSLAVITNIRLNNIHPDYRVVSVTVKSVYNARIGNDVYVIYQNKEYKLKGVTDSELPKLKTYCELNRPVEVYLADDGNLYSNTRNIANSTFTGKLYFTFLFATIFLIFSTSIFIACVVEAKKREKGIYPRRGF